MITMIPVWILGGNFVAAVILLLSFRGPSLMAASDAAHSPRHSRETDGMRR